MPNHPEVEYNKRLHFLPEPYLVYNTPSRSRVVNNTQMLNWEKPC
jgi:hypothetical protein